MFYSTDPHDRAEFIAALRALASFLDCCPAAPVPSYGSHITLSADSFEEGGKAQVDHLAVLLHAIIADDTKNGGHYIAARSFGPIGYQVVSIPAACTARYNAEKSYWGCITPDPDPVSRASCGSEPADSASAASCPEPGCDRTQPCEGCRETEELDNRIASVRRTQEAWWL